jgi:hypothetical protein
MSKSMTMAVARRWLKLPVQAAPFRCGIAFIKERLSGSNTGIAAAIAFALS